MEVKYDLQSMMKALSTTMRGIRMQYHVTLGKLIVELKKHDGRAPVVFSTGGSPDKERSYRGYYEDLSFDSKEEKTTCGELLERCEKALGSTYQGYKGGDFVMEADTPLWRAEYGSCGEAIIDMEFDGETLHLICKDIDSE